MRVMRVNHKAVVLLTAGFMFLCQLQAQAQPATPDQQSEQVPGVSRHPEPSHTVAILPVSGKSMTPQANTAASYFPDIIILQRQASRNCPFTAALWKCLRE